MTTPDPWHAACSRWPRQAVYPDNLRQLPDQPPWKRAPAPAPPLRTATPDVMARARLARGGRGGDLPPGRFQRAAQAARPEPPTKQDDDTPGSPRWIDRITGLWSRR